VGALTALVPLVCIPVYALMPIAEEEYMATKSGWKKVGESRGDPAAREPAVSLELPSVGGAENPIHAPSSEFEEQAAEVAGDDRPAKVKKQFTLSSVFKSV